MTIIQLLNPIQNHLKVNGFLSGQWIRPFDNENGLQMLCTNNNHHEIMRGKESPLVTFKINNYKNFTFCSLFLGNFFLF